MQKYQGSETSGVASYELSEDAITLKFVNDNFLYLYDYVKPGRIQVEKMKELAVSGQGLTTYVNKNVRANYKRKWAQLQRV